MPYVKGTPSDLKRQKAREVTKLSKEERDKQLGPGVTRNPHPKAGKSGGVPEFIIDEERLKMLARNMNPIEDIALMLGVTVKFIRDHYQQVLDEGYSEMRGNLRSAQLSTALGGNVIGQIWLGKQYLGQKDISRTEQTGPDGKPIEITKTKRVVAYIPDNGRDPAPDATPK